MAFPKFWGIRDIPLKILVGVGLKCFCTPLPMIGIVADSHTITEITLIHSLCITKSFFSKCIPLITTVTVDDPTQDYTPNIFCKS